MFGGKVRQIRTKIGVFLLKRVLTLFCTVAISGCSNFLSNKIPFQSSFEFDYKIVQKRIKNKLSFLPYVHYVPISKPTENGETLLKELLVYENIVNDHLVFGRGKTLGINESSYNIFRKINLSRSKKVNETVNEKKFDIQNIRSITSRYEKWFLIWEEKTDLVGTELTLDEIDLIQSEIKRISKKL